MVRPHLSKHPRRCGGSIPSHQGACHEGKKDAVADEDLTTRALERWSSNIKTKQRNTERVAVKTVELLSEQEMPREAAAPDEDFMGLFSDIAENASSEGLSDLLARILAGEIRKPGSVSRRTLQVVQTLDQRAITAILEVAPYVSNTGLIYVPATQFAPWSRHLRLLFNLGILTEVGMRFLPVDAHGKGTLVVANGTKAILYNVKREALSLALKPEDFTLLVEGTNITPVTEELLPVLPVTSDVDLLHVANGMRMNSDISWVREGRCVFEGGEFVIPQGRNIYNN